jgi:molecular chaperone GrpE (heat shock protein)
VVEDPNLFAFGGVLFVISLALISTLKKESEPAPDPTAIADEVEQLRRQCERLRAQLSDQQQQITRQVHRDTFEELQSLLTQYPSACQFAREKPELPARNLIALFTPLATVLENWGYEAIGTPWERVDYNPQWHQADTDSIQPGELVYIRFIGYRQGDRILCPAKVSRTLPPGID